MMTLHQQAMNFLTHWSRIKIDSISNREMTIFSIHFRVLEYVDHLHEHFVEPVVIKMDVTKYLR